MAYGCCCAWASPKNKRVTQPVTAESRRHFPANFPRIASRSSQRTSCYANMARNSANAPGRCATSVHCGILAPMRLSFDPTFGKCSVSHLCHMHCETRFRQQRSQLKHFETVAGDFCLAIEAGLGFGCFVASLQVVEKFLCISEAGFSALGARHHSLGGIGAHK